VHRVGLLYNYIGDAGQPNIKKMLIFILIKVEGFSLFPTEYKMEQFIGEMLCFYVSVCARISAWLRTPTPARY
jgi:hypothetical protein